MATGVATITCPRCGTRTIAPMPDGVCQFFWECPGCLTVLRPKPGDCCVFCSYGDRACPTARKDRPAR